MALVAPDPDPQETREWLDAMRGVLAVEGNERARVLIERLVDEAQSSGAQVSLGRTTPYVNTIPADRQPPMPGDRELEARLRHYVRWNALAMVVRANKVSSELGGHVASFASAATLYDVGFNHFFRAPSDTFGGDLVFFQGHSSPGVYARAFLEGRITEEQLEHFRQEVDGKGLSSYPHPWLMPEFWQFPTVSMGLGPIMSIYQARFMRYLHDRGLLDTTGRKVWTFVGDGEMDEPESLGAISLAGREKLDNLIWVVNANLQRLDGPVRGNGKIIQELEGVFRGAGWNVIKVIWGSRWDPLLAADKSGRLTQLMNECVDGDYQTFKSRNGKYVRDEFFGRYPETKSLVEDWTDDEIWNLQRGGHDSIKVYAAYKAAFEHRGQPTVVLAKTIKGYGMGEAGEAQNIAHQAKKMEVEAMRVFRDRFALPISDAALAGDTIPFYKPADEAPEMLYLRERLAELGSVPQRRRKSASLAVPELSTFDAQLQGDGRPAYLNDHGLRSDSQCDRARSRNRSARRSDRRRRIAHVRHGRHVPAARHLLVGRPALPPARCRAADVVPRGQAGPDPAGRHQRSRRALVVDRRGNLVFESRPSDDSVLHLLFDVRISARRRSDVGCRRQPNARFLTRRHVRANDAQR